jgi:hypothetical protein
VIQFSGSIQWESPVQWETLVVSEMIPIGKYNVGGHVLGSGVGFGWLFGGMLHGRWVFTGMYCCQ